MKKIIAAACAAAFLLSAGCSEIVKTADYSSEVKVSDTETVTEAKDEREPLNYGQQQAAMQLRSLAQTAVL